MAGARRHPRPPSHPPSPLPLGTSAFETLSGTPRVVLFALPHARHSCEGRNPEGRGAGVSVPHRIPHSPPPAPLPNPFALSLSKGAFHHQQPPHHPRPRAPHPGRRGGSRTARPRERAPTLTPTPRANASHHTPHRRSRSRGNPGQGRGAGRLRPPSHPPLPSPKSVRPEPVDGPPPPTTTSRPSRTRHSPGIQRGRCGASTGYCRGSPHP